SKLIKDESIYEFANNYDPKDLVKDTFVEDEFESEHNSENGYFHDY
ncbi:9197_t:CDS:1, partial [Entrophospora sp. SA101]